jgi:cardiolipin synthase (CMP-forming)
MASTPILAYWIIYDYPTLALAGCAIAGASDFADGYLAKKYNMTTTLGTYLDPLADKVVINVLALSCWTTAILPTPLVLLWATKDILLIAGTGVYLQQQEKSMNFLRTSVTQTPLQVQPSLLGKANTALQFACLGVAIVQPLQTTPELLMGLW